MQLKRTYTLFISLVLISSYLSIAQNNESNKIALLTTQNTFIAGQNITLIFSVSENIKPLLYCSNSYGSTIINPVFKNDELQYVIPSSMCNKIGILNWKLLNDKTLLSGKIKINPKQNVASIETYIGPPSIEAGETDFTMLVVIPTDSLDNPIAENTLVNAKHQFLTTEESEEIFTKNLIAYKTIYSQKESGRMLVSSECLNTNSKEFTINVLAAIPTNFTISSIRPHDYADGNQITTFSTSVLKDKQDNVVSDGTFVSFFITNSKGNILKTSGTTINGVANAKMIHPDYQEQWRIKAYVEGMAESNMIALNYKQVIENFKVEFSKNNRKITVGPLQSFMKQMIPDGLQVKLSVYKNNILLETYIETSYDGFTRFNLKPVVFKKGSYTIVINAAGLEKTFKSKALW